MTEERLMRSEIGEPLERHPGLVTIDFHRPSPWTQGLVGLVKWLCWHTEVVVGKTKNDAFKQTIGEVLGQLGLPDTELDALLAHLKKVAADERKEDVPTARFDDFRGGRYLHPFEATRRIRFFTEDFLNKEFDVFMSLLPSALMSRFLSEHFEIEDIPGMWHVFGNSNDLEFTMGVTFMEVDTLAYHPASQTLVAFELKVDAALGERQILKYCTLVAALEDRGLIDKGCEFKLLVIGAADALPVSSQALREESLTQLAEKRYPKRGLALAEAERLHPQIESVLMHAELAYTSWQDFGGWFDAQLPALQTEALAEGTFRLIDGFLCSLAHKYSRKQKRVLYQASTLAQKQQDATARDDEAEPAPSLDIRRADDAERPWIQQQRTTINLLLILAIFICMVLLSYLTFAF